MPFAHILNACLSYLQSAHFNNHHGETRRAKSTSHDSNQQRPYQHHDSHQVGTYSPQPSHSNEQMAYRRSSFTIDNGVHNRSGHQQYSSNSYQQQTSTHHPHGHSLQYHPSPNATYHHSRIHHTSSSSTVAPLSHHNNQHNDTYYGHPPPSPQQTGYDPTVHHQHHHTHPHTLPTIPHQAHVHAHEIVNAPQYHPDPQQYTNQAYAGNNSYQTKSSSSSRPLGNRDLNQHHHHHSSGHHRRSHQDSMQIAAMQPNFTRRRSTNHQSYNQHESSRLRSSNDPITHHSNHQHESSRRCSTNDSTTRQSNHQHASSRRRSTDDSNHHHDSNPYQRST